MPSSQLEITEEIEQNTSVYKGNRPNSIFIMSAATSIDLIFSDWIFRAKLDQNSFEPFDLNVLNFLPQRENNAAHYNVDPPLAERGHIEAHLAGLQLHRCGISSLKIYCSPQLKCVQTAHEIGALFRECVKIVVEPALSSHYFPRELLIPFHNFAEFGLMMKSFINERAFYTTDSSRNFVDIMKRVLQTFQSLLEKVKNNEKLFDVLFIVDSTIAKLLTDFCQKQIDIDLLEFYVSKHWHNGKSISETNLSPVSAMCFNWTIPDENKKTDLCDQPNFSRSIINVYASNFQMI